MHTRTASGDSHCAALSTSPVPEGERGRAASLRRRTQRHRPGRRAPSSSRVRLDSFHTAHQHHRTHHHYHFRRCHHAGATIITNSPARGESTIRQGSSDREFADADTIHTSTYESVISGSGVPSVLAAAAGTRCYAIRSREAQLPRGLRGLHKATAKFGGARSTRSARRVSSLVTGRRRAARAGDARRPARHNNFAIFVKSRGGFIYLAASDSAQCGELVA
jgi:hypothetical protein